MAAARSFHNAIFQLNGKVLIMGALISSNERKQATQNIFSKLISKFLPILFPLSLLLSHELDEFRSCPDSI